MASLLDLINQSSSSRVNHANQPRMQPEIEISLGIDTDGGIFSCGGVTEGEENESSRGGVYISWEDLWVTVSKGRTSEPILQGLTGYARPGEVLGIMGPSGCGKSTLLDALAGRLNSNTRKSGDILINGRKQALAYGTSAYVMQDDMLISTLTIREAIYYSAQLQLPSFMSIAEKKARAEATIREMGLQDAGNTRIGGSWGGDKGLSGGQKRRVSICLEMLNHPQLLFLDEPTSGLDSAASYYVMSRLARLSKNLDTRRTIVVSIHQPSSEVFQMFDNLCLLSTGKTVFFGPTADANEFFALNGFPCPTLQNPSDHFLKTINKDFDTDIEKGFGSQVSADEAIDNLTKSYKTSTHYEYVQRKVAEIQKQESVGHGIPEKRRKHAGFLTQCSVLTRRSCLNMYRDMGYFWLRLAIYITITVGLGFLFYNIGSSYGSIQARGALLMFISSFLTYMSIGGFPSFVEDMKVFRRERLNGHYGASAFVVSNTFSSAPYLLLVSLIPGTISYFLPGLHPGFGHFMYFMLTLFACMMLVESLMMIVASLVPNYLMGIIVGSGIQGLMMLGGGFFRLPDDLPRLFWRYPIYYIAFHRYAFEGLFKNEFEGLEFPSQSGGGGARMDGDRILRDVWEIDVEYSKWVNLAVLLGMVVVYRLIFLGIIKTNEVIKPKMSALMAVVPTQANVTGSPTCSTN